ncbi:RNA recognition motif domain-containing protein, partial [Salmonella sp. s51090]|uniref:RNA recognition motif domain-containing protein n=1 Tax=Salmonella sp. s51090 TaxID=3159651 RepID=UPI0039802FD1
MTESGKVYVGNLSFDTTEDQIRDAFGKLGAIDDVNIITDRETGRSRGFAFVQFEDASSALKAIDLSNNFNL